ncbi:MAG: energy transducer TonB, partial [Acidobacteriota bacterium]
MPRIAKVGSTPRRRSAVRFWGSALLLSSLLVFPRTALALQETVPARPQDGNPAPEYPEEATRAMVTGPVTFAAQVDAAGKVMSVRVVNVPRPGLGFEEAVIDAVKRWRFDPGRRAGEAVSSLFVGRVGFQLDVEAEEAIEKLMERGAALWNSRDARALLELLRKDGLVTFPCEGNQGKAGIEAWLSRNW